MDLTWLTDAINFVLDKLNQLAEFQGALKKAAFKQIWPIVQDVLCYLIDVLVAGVSAAVQGVAALVPAGVATSWASYWSAVPSAAVDVAVAVGFVPALAIVSLALVIRFALQLIPFVRLGS